MRYLLSALFVICTVIETFPQRNVPETEITNGIIRAKLYLPDIEKGYYRATRFDWSGIIPDLQYLGHSFYGKWFENYDPEIHDVIMGPVEEFGQVGYAEAGMGETFLKIGVGMLLKTDETPYNSFRLYRIVDPGKWKIKKKSGQVQFVHLLNDTEYSYEYMKIVRLVKDKPRMVIEHSLKNTGNKAIVTTVYDHNFLMIDNEPTGPGYLITFPFDLSGRGMGIGEIAAFKGKQIRFLREMTKSERIYCGAVTGFGVEASDYDFTVDNLKTGAGVRVTCDQPISRMVFWCSPVTVCPEPYIDITVRPGQTFSWTLSFEYFIK